MEDVLWCSPTLLAPGSPPSPLVCTQQRGCVPVLHPRALQAWGSPPAHPALPGIDPFRFLTFPVLGKICPHCSAWCTVPTALPAAQCAAAVPSRSKQRQDPSPGPGNAGESFACIMNMFLLMNSNWGWRCNWNQILCHTYCTGLILFMPILAHRSSPIFTENKVKPLNRTSLGCALPVTKLSQGVPVSQQHLVPSAVPMHSVFLSQVA